MDFVRAMRHCGSSPSAIDSAAHAAGVGAAVSEPHRASGRALCRGRHRRHRRARARGQACAVRSGNRSWWRTGRARAAPSDRRRSRRRRPTGTRSWSARPARWRSTSTGTKELGYDPVKDLQPVALATVVPLALVVPGKASYSTVAEMLDGVQDARAVVRVGGRGDAGALLRRGAQAADQEQHDPRALQRRGAGAERYPGRARRLFFSGFPAAVPHVKAGTHEAARGLHGQALGRRAGRADGRGSERHQGFRHRAVAGIFRAARHAAGRSSRGCTPRSTRSSCSRTSRQAARAGAEVTTISIDEFAAFAKAESAKFLADHQGRRPEAGMSANDTRSGRTSCDSAPPISASGRGRCRAAGGLRASPGRRPIRRGRCASSSALPPAAASTSSRA